MRSYSIVIFAIVVFIVLLFQIPEAFVTSDLGDTVLTISTFLFGILSGFYIVVTTTDYNRVKTLAAEETAAWISLFHNVRLYHPESVEKLKALMDEYIRRSFDHEFIDYARNTNLEFNAAQNFIEDLPLKADSPSYEKVLDILESLVRARQELTVLGTKTLSVFEWLVLFVLGGLVVLTLYGLRSGDLFFNIVTVAVASAIVLILVLIKDIDNYAWNEKTFSFDPFNNVLTAIGNLPYYPAEFIHLMKPTEKSYRVGTLTSPGKSWHRSIVVKEI